MRLYAGENVTIRVNGRDFRPKTSQMLKCQSRGCFGNFHMNFENKFTFQTFQKSPPGAGIRRISSRKLEQDQKNEKMVDILKNITKTDIFFEGVFPTFFFF
uniref:Uncharacterized protein n=1 Tax=Cacopsylla melanoneura TaxID=428564 RepID=A0A8D9E9H2_9HEMI